MTLDQKVVFAGLSRMTQDRSVIQSAFIYWQDNHSSDAFDIIKVTVGIESYLGLSQSEKKTLMIALHAASNKSESELDDVPAYILGTKPQAVSEAEAADAVDPRISPDSAHYLVTSEFIRLLVTIIEKKDIDGFRDIHAILLSEGLPEVDIGTNERIKKNGFSETILSKNAEPDECREIAHQLYLLIIDVIGPVVSDDIINQVIDKLIDNSGSQKFDPRSLI